MVLAATFAEAPPICPKEEDAEEEGVALKFPIENWGD